MMLFNEERSNVSFPCHVGCTGFYMMASTAANVLPAGRTAVLVSPVHPGNAKTECVHFWYNVGGENPGETPFTCKHLISSDIKAYFTTGNFCRLSDVVFDIPERREGKDLFKQSEPRRHVAPWQWEHRERSAGMAGRDKFILQLFL